MIAKLIVHAPTRTAAADALARAAGEAQVWPVRTNAAFLSRAAAHPDFVAARVDTGFIERHLDALVGSGEPSAGVLRAAAEALASAPTGDAWTDLRGFRANAAPVGTVAVELAGRTHLADLGDDEPSPAAEVAVVDGETVLFLGGEAWPFGPPRADHAGGAASLGDGALLAPMPGRIVEVSVVEGEAVAKGQRLVTLEAMKMEQALLAPFDGVVAELKAKAGAQVAEGNLLVRVAPEGAG